MDLERILLIVAGAFLMQVADWCLTFWRNAENRRTRTEAERRNDGFYRGKE